MLKEEQQPCFGKRGKTTKENVHCMICGKYLNPHLLSNSLLSLVHD